MPIPRARAARDRALRFDLGLASRNGFGGLLSGSPQLRRQLVSRLDLLVVLDLQQIELGLQRLLLVFDLLLQTVTANVQRKREASSARRLASSARRLASSLGFFGSLPPPEGFLQRRGVCVMRSF